MFDYLRSKNTALRMLEKFGRLIQVEQVTTGVYDPATSGVVNTTTTQDVYAADFAMKGESYEGNLIRAGDRKAIIGATVDIEINNHLIIDSKKWSIVGLNKLAPAGDAVLYIAHIRK